MNYSVKNVKTFRGHDGDGFNATLYRDGKKIALVDDDARGGEFRYEWLDRDADKVDITVKGYNGKDFTRKGTPEEKMFSDLAHSQTFQMNGMKEPMTKNMDIVVDELINAHLEEKQLKRWCRTKTVVRLKGAKKGSYATYASKYDERMKQFLATKEDIEEVINERFAA